MWCQLASKYHGQDTAYAGLLLDILLVLLEKTWLELDVAGLVAARENGSQRAVQTHIGMQLCLHSVNVTEAGSLLLVVSLIS